MTYAVQTNALSRRFGRREAIHDLNITLARGSIYGLVGPNGAGKTTTLRTLINLLKPTSGHATVLGADSRRLGPRELARIGYVGDQASLPGWMSVDGLIGYSRRFYPTWDDGFRVDLQRRFRLPGDRLVGRLSRGERARLAVLLALSYRPELLLLDEPFAGLDPLAREEIGQGTLTLAGEGEWSILIASHDIAEVERLVDQVGYLDSGRLLFSEPLTELQERCREVEIVLGDDGAGLPGLPESWPADWLDFRRGDRVIRFLDRDYQPERTAAAVRRFFPAFEQLEVVPASLEQIFIAHARASQGGNDQ